MNPYSQSSGYMGLLHSQHESVLHENSPYESFHSGSSEIPQFSSQQCVKAAKAKRSNGQGKSVADYTSVWEMRQEDLVSSNMGLDYSYTQLSQSEEFGGDEAESDSEIEALIHQDQAELSYMNGEEIMYPPQPEVEFGFPQTCYCGSQPQLATSQSRTDPGRRYYTCSTLMMESAMFGNGGMRLKWRR
ncbi:hypothetical protein DY000_02063060 [Brassica cretica]|uniref:Dof-type domain-containing protein n=1 Tax=Brassica cretica TaxID=69181 RepID=A0ABQ7ATW0_BRACR|nr:hypothetical protein DY000_02063060 [Brassica cretica]